MDIAATKLELLQHLMSISDPKTLKRVAVFFKKEVPKAVEEEDDLTDEEVAELEKRFQDMVSGKVKGHSRAESNRLVRKAIKA